MKELICHKHQTLKSRKPKSYHFILSNFFELSK